MLTKEARYNRNQQILQDLKEGLSLEMTARKYRLSIHQIVRIRAAAIPDPYHKIQSRSVLPLPKYKANYRGLIVVCDTLDDLDRLADHVAGII